MLVTAALALLSAGAWITARRVLYRGLYERLERAASQGGLPTAMLHEGLVVVAPPPDRRDTAGEAAAGRGADPDPIFSVGPDSVYGDLAILRFRDPDGHAGALATPARNEVQALRIFGALLGGLTLASGLAALPAGYLLAGRALEPLGEAIRERSAFVALASHRLRTPLSVIRTSAELALAGQGVGADEALHIILAQSAEMEGLAARLTTLARTSARVAPDRVAIDISATAQHVAATVRPAGVQHGPRLRLHTDTAVWAAAPGTALADALSSVLENALRFTPAGRGVTVRTSRTAQWAVVEVTDEGPGIAAEDLRHVTEPFFQGRRGGQANGGSGLGLAIASAAMQRLRGRIQITSHLGEGTTVRLLLPLARGPLRRRPPADRPAL